MFYDNYESICRKNGSNASAVAMSVGLARSTSASWKAHGTIPKQDVLDKLAEKLDCSVSDFFIENTDNSVNFTNSSNCSNNISKQTTNSEDELLQLFKTLKTQKEKHQFMAAAYDAVDKIKGDNNE